ncbi:MAG: ferredoxin reductase family protein [Deltaproteobacteria bacterium]|nr:ferredoxin reductase family protein [Deltaproteobacteria bacterium]
MNLQKGVWAVVALFVAYAAAYWHYVIAAAMPFGAQFSYFAGSGSVICMALALMLSARPRAVETWFGGLDRMYKLHKYLGVAALLLFIAHFATVPGGGPDDDAAAATAVSVQGGAATPAPPPAPAEPAAPDEEGGLPVGTVGLVAMIGFTLLIIITLNRKIPYHRWITTHRFMGLFFTVVSVHVFLVLYEGEEIAFFSAPGVFLALLLLAGLAAYAYKQILYPASGKRPFTVTAVNRLERATEVVLRSKDGMFAFEPGQFAFVTIDAAGFREAHPFTISSGATEDGLRFTMKVLGDYTRRVRDDLSAGADVAIEGPYGRFSPLRGSEKQVWVAGGIGITPFLSVLRTMAPGHGKTVRLYYCVRTASEALFLGELKARAADLGGVTITLFTSDAGARIDADAIRADLGEALTDWSYYLCGPKPMVAAVSDGFAKRGVSARRIHNEEFEFR